MPDSRFQIIRRTAAAVKLRSILYGKRADRGEIDLAQRERWSFLFADFVSRFILKYEEVYALGEQYVRERGVQQFTSRPNDYILLQQFRHYLVEKAGEMKRWPTAGNTKNGLTPRLAEEPGYLGPGVGAKGLRYEMIDAADKAVRARKKRQKAASS